MVAAHRIPFVAGALLCTAALACLSAVALRRPSRIEALEFVQVSPDAVQQLMWIAPPNANRPGDFWEFRENCLAACDVAQLERERCYQQSTNDAFVRYQAGCAGADQCACEMKSMSCGGGYQVKRHPNWGPPGYCT